VATDKSSLNSSLKKIAKGAGITFIGFFIGRALGFLSRIVIVRFISVGDYGLINLGFAVMSIVATFSLLGLTAGISRYVPFYKGKGDERRIKGTIVSALLLSFPVSLILASIIFIGSNWVALNVFKEPELTPVLRIFCIAIPFSVISQNIIAATIGFQDLKYKVYVNDLFQNIFKLIVIIVLLSSGMGVLGATWGWVLSIILTPFLAFYFLERKVFPILKTKVKSIPVKKELLSFSASLWNFT